MSLTDDDKKWLSNLMDQKFEGLETKRLTAFQQWASPVEMRQRSHAAAIRALDVEIEALKDRVAKLEGGR